MRDKIPAKIGKINEMLSTHRPIVRARRTGNRDDKLGVTLCKWDISLAVEMPSCQMKPRPVPPDREA